MTRIIGRRSLLWTIPIALLGSNMIAAAQPAGGPGRGMMGGSGHGMMGGRGRGMIGGYWDTGTYLDAFAYGRGMMGRR